MKTICRKIEEFLLPCEKIVIIYGKVTSFAEKKNENSKKHTPFGMLFAQS